MYVTLETALLWLGSTSHLAEENSNRLMQEWLASGRMVFVVNANEALHQKIESKSENVFSRKVLFECVFSGTDILAHLTRCGIRRVVFCGADLEGIVETNIRAACSRGLQCLLPKDGVSFQTLDKGFEARISRYCDFVEFRRIIEDLPIPVKEFG